MKKFVSIVIIAIMTEVFFQMQTFCQSLISNQKRVALVIGNGNYKSSILSNPENDARDIQGMLQKLGFTVYKYENLTASQMKKSIDDFGSVLGGNDVGLFYYAGHGIQSKGFNYLIPVDAEINSEEQVDYDCVRADRVLSLMEAAGTKVNIIILDACRNNPFERGWTRSATGRGLAFMTAPRGTLIAYATAPGSTASDGSGKNGLYTSALLESLQIPNITVIQMFQNVRNIVNKKSNNQQIPWESTSLTGDFYFDLNSLSNTYFDSINNTAVLIPGLKSKSNSSMTYALQREYLWSVLSISTQVRGYTENGYSASNKFGNWIPGIQLYQTKVYFDDYGVVNALEDYAPRKELNNTEKENSNPKLIGKSVFKLINNDSISVTKYNTAGKISEKYYLFFQNDTTVLRENELFILDNYKLSKLVSPKDYKTEKFWTYDKNGFVSNIKSFSNKKMEIVNRYDYLEFDSHGNWTSRIEYATSTSPNILVIRSYDY